MQSSDCRTNIMKYQIETCWKILEITIKSKMNQMKNVSPNIRKKHCAGAECIWSVAIFRVHTFLFMAPQTQLPSFISYCCLHKTQFLACTWLKLQCKLQEAREIIFQIILELGIFWITDRSFNHSCNCSRQLCAAAHLCTFFDKIKILSNILCFLKVPTSPVTG